MNRLALLISIVTCFTVANPLNGSAVVQEVTLLASQVTSARDIELAVEAATASGSHPGIVTLDSSAGAFTYTGEDRSINIYYSDVTLRSRNGAALANCGDGIFFDDFVTENVVIEGIRFTGENGVVAAYGLHPGVTIRRNVFITNGSAISARGADHWNITDNYALSHGYPIHLLDSRDTRISSNILINTQPGIGVFLERSNANVVSQNRIVNGWQGILIGWDSSDNRVTNNWIYLIQQAGISFEGDNERNSVLANQISCQPDIECRIVNADNPPLAPTNKVQGNKFMRQDPSG